MSNTEKITRLIGEEIRYILREKCFKFNAPCCEFRIDNIMNGDNEGFLCEVKFPLKCKATDLDFFCLYTYIIMCHKQFDNFEM